MKINKEYIKNNVIIKNIWKILLLIFYIIVLVSIIYDYERPQPAYITSYYNIIIMLFIIFTPIVCGYKIGKNTIKKYNNLYMKYILISIATMYLFFMLYINYLMYLNIGESNPEYMINKEFILYTLSIIFIPSIIGYEIGKCN